MPIGMYDTEEYCPSVEEIYAQAAAIRANDTPEKAAARLMGMQDELGVRSSQSEASLGRAAKYSFYSPRRRGGLH